MISFPLFIIAATIWFLVLVALRSALGWKLCAACAAISSSWLALIILRLSGINVSPLLIAVLMGESVVGLYYFLEKRIPEGWQLFRWPYLMTATVAVLGVVGMREKIFIALGLLVIMWLAFILIYAGRTIPAFKKIMERLIACCRDW